MKDKIDSLYRDRTNFCVIGLTGYTAVGCSRLAEYMADKEFYRREEVRAIDSIMTYGDISVDNNHIFFTGGKHQIQESLGLAIFKRKYAICHNFIENNYEPFRVIKYSKAMWILALIRIAEIVNDGTEFKSHIFTLIADRFSPSHRGLDKNYKPLEGDSFWTEELMPDLNYCALLNEIKAIHGEKAKGGESLLADIFDDTDEPKASTIFFEQMNKQMFMRDYYCACFFYHRLGMLLRTGAEITLNSDEVYEGGLNGNYSIDRIYDVVRFISVIIRSLRMAKDSDEKLPCRVVIDRLRTSLEARYLKERYSAFYLISVHDEGQNADKHLRKKIIENYGWDEKQIQEHSAYLDRQTSAIIRLGRAECKNDDFEKGIFGAPNIEQCVADAEIHISNSESIDVNSPYFRTMAEQWLKFATLIFHPGLITPSAEERCMVVAYTAKFNSGCISRQVGAVITNAAHSIRTIGWNDVPYGQIPCSLRSLSDLAEDNTDPLIFSDFERGLSASPYAKGNFRENVSITRPHLRTDTLKKTLKGLPYSYCFKSLHNQFEGKNNQVHTRSLHAEENAILQMSRFGGQPLEDGVIYVTASPCELCCKKLYQIGVRKIIYIDEYPGISRQNIIAIGYKRPQLKQFQGAYGTTYFKLYQPVMPYKDELSLRLGDLMSEKDEFRVISSQVRDSYRNGSDEVKVKIVESFKTLLDTITKLDKG